MTRKITRAVARIHHGLQTELCLGNLDARRDWGHARDFVLGMWMMLQADAPEDFVLATGEMHSVREFVEAAFDFVGVKIKWENAGVDEIGVCGDKVLVRVDPRYFRPAEVELLVGDASKAKAKLGWECSVRFADLVRDMMTFDLEDVLLHGRGKKE